jgi:tetratricopeptide (TPR) repeat protein
MKHPAIYILTFLLGTALHGEAQLSLTNKAARQCQEKDYASAESTISRALESESEMNHPYAWYVSGYIQKEIYKTSEAGLRSSQRRTRAVSDMEKALSLDTGREYAEMIRAGLKYRATTYLNDALLASREIQKGSEQQPEVLFREFERLMAIAEPSSDLRNYRKELDRKMAQAHYFLWEKDIAQMYHAEKAMDFYQRVLVTDPADCEANYNIAILHYNNGVHKIRRIGSSTDIMELIMIQDECVALFRSALPYAEKTFSNCPPRLDYYKAMMFINRALGNEDIHDEYKAKSEDLIRRGILKK